MQFSELQTELQARLSVASSNTFWTPAMIKVWLNEANKWACNYKKWPFTEKAVYTSSKANAFYYDYPLEFKSDSISRLEIEKSDGKMKEYKKVRYQDFMKYIRDNPDGEDLIFSHIHHQQYFLVLFSSLSFIIGGIAVIRIYARLFLGNFIKSSSNPLKSS